MTQDIDALLNDIAVHEQGIRRDRWGRYLLADPETGEIKPFQRASSVARTLSDNFALEKWMQRHLVFGMGLRRDLWAKAASVASMDEKDVLAKVVDEALEAAAAGTKANLGTAIHRFTERVDSGEVVNVPEDWAEDIHAYQQKMKQYGITPVDGWTERIVLNPEIGIAGRIDRLLQQATWKLPRIGDVKTGLDIEKKMNEIAVQLAIYANCTYWYDLATNTYHEMPPIDRKSAIVMHVPIETGTCQLIDVDVEAGWQGVQIALALRDWRKRKDLWTPLQDWSVPGVASLTENGKLLDTPEPIPPNVPVDGVPGVVRSIDNEALMDTPAPVSEDKPQKRKRRTKAEMAAARGAVGGTNEGAAPIVGGTEAVTETVFVEPDRAPEVDNFPQRFEWIKARVAYILHSGQEQSQTLALLWANTSPAVPYFKNSTGPRTHEEIDLLAGTCALAEAKHQLSFFDPDPKHVKSNPYIEGNISNEQLPIN